MHGPLNVKSNKRILWNANRMSSCNICYSDSDQLSSSSSSSESVFFFTVSNWRNNFLNLLDRISGIVANTTGVHKFCTVAPVSPQCGTCRMSPLITQGILRWLLDLWGMRVPLDHECLLSSAELYTVIFKKPL